MPTCPQIVSDGTPLLLLRRRFVTGGGGSTLLPSSRRCPWPWASCHRRSHSHRAWVSNPLWCCWIRLHTSIVGVLEARRQVVDAVTIAFGDHPVDQICHPVVAPTLRRSVPPPSCRAPPADPPMPGQASRREQRRACTERDAEKSATDDGFAQSRNANIPVNGPYVVPNDSLRST
jgi:hypothetical protein